MHHIEIPEARLNLYLPHDLSECDKQQYMDMCELIFRMQAGELLMFDMRVQAVYKLLNLKPAKKNLVIVDEEAKWGNIYELSKLVNTFFEDQEGKQVIKMNYTHNPVPEFRPLWKTYHGPANSFMNVTFGEYTDGLRLFLDFTATGNTNLLYLLAAIFYRPKKSFHWLKRIRQDYDGDIRQPYNPALIDKRAEALKYAPIGFIFGFYLFFASFQKYLTGALIPWGGKELDFSILFEGGDEGQLEAVPGLGMDGLSLALAESGVYGDMKGVRNTNMWEVMLRLYDLKKKDLDHKLNDKSKPKS